MLFMPAAVILDVILQLQRNEPPFPGIPAHLCGVGPCGQPILLKRAHVLRGIAVIYSCVLLNAVILSSIE